MHHYTNTEPEKWKPFWFEGNIWWGWVTSFEIYHRMLSTYEDMAGFNEDDILQAVMAYDQATLGEDMCPRFSFRAHPAEGVTLGTWMCEAGLITDGPPPDPDTIRTDPDTPEEVPKAYVLKNQDAPLQEPPMLAGENPDTNPDTDRDKVSGSGQEGPPPWHLDDADEVARFKEIINTREKASRVNEDIKWNKEFRMWDVQQMAPDLWNYYNTFHFRHKESAEYVQSYANSMLPE